MERDDARRRCPMIGRVLVADATKLTGHHLGWEQFSAQPFCGVCSRSVAESAAIAVFPGGDVCPRTAAVEDA